MSTLSEVPQSAAARGIQYAHDSDTDLQPAPIDPSWILAGAPEARIKFLHTTPDQRYAVALWDCTAGRFRWYFGYDEVVHILEGEVTVHEDDGNERTLRAGDVALFPKGSTAVWEVPRYIRKLAINRFHRPTPVELLKQALRRGRDEVKKRLNGHA